jgi:predicted Holliday junction resolvase-like endonuclease
MKKSLLVVAAVLAAAVPVNWIWQAKAGREEIEEENAWIESMHESRERAYRAAVKETAARRKHEAHMELLERHQREMEEMSERHDRERLADRISENLRPGSTGDAALKHAEEFSKLLQRHEREMEELEK